MGDRANNGGYGWSAGLYPGGGNSSISNPSPFSGNVPRVGYAPGPLGGHSDLDTQIRFHDEQYEKYYGARDRQLALDYPLMWLFFYYHVPLPLFSGVMFVMMWYFTEIAFNDLPIMIPLMPLLWILPTFLWLRYAVLFVTFVFLARHHMIGGFFAPYLGWSVNAAKRVWYGRNYRKYTLRGLR